MSVPLMPLRLEAIGTELAVAWSDGAESFIPLEKIRRACPCAFCGGEPDVLGRVARPEIRYTPESFRLKTGRLVGSYAWQPSWADGHASGLFTFTQLQKLA